MKFEVMRSLRHSVPSAVAEFTDGFVAVEFARNLTQAEGVHEVAIFLRPGKSIEVSDSGETTIHIDD